MISSYTLIVCTVKSAEVIIMATITLFSSLDGPLKILKMFGMIRLETRDKGKRWLYQIRTILIWILNISLIFPQGIQLFMVQSIEVFKQLLHSVT